MSVCAKFQLSSLPRSGWKVCGRVVVGNTWLLCLTPTLVALELLWVELSCVGFWQKLEKLVAWPGIELGSPANMASSLTIELPYRAMWFQKLCCTGLSDPFQRALHLKVKVVGLEILIWCLRQCYEAMNCWTLIGRTGTKSVREPSFHMTCFHLHLL